MCIAVPMEIMGIDEETGKARAFYRGNELIIDTRLVSARVGDFVLVHAGCAIEVVRETDALESERLLHYLEELAKNGT